ncbi:hypothetical protein AXE65_04450 [Ventosimonas gracilis]|uniref:DUF4810 domain-containing protein n=1 Tax=Ventosimonas gracilis TaxID=1680762 RepID=A0A139SQT9_9GAMM|nr:DUF4810 domain-containing protein [Ventosimonas gracilis]KXU36897.1 hypothetical protein AXE65_04450 [Ventosimonas gracilis]
MFDGFTGRLLLMLLAALLLTGCAGNGKRSLYAWGDYPDHTYRYLKGEEQGWHEDISALEEHARKAEAGRRDLPPGFRAHLALLYLKAGQPDLAIGYLQAEKKAFPESSVFIDFQLKGLKNINPAQQETE